MCDSVSIINQTIVKDIQDIVNAYERIGQEPQFFHVEHYSSQELRKRGWIG